MGALLGLACATACGWHSGIEAPAGAQSVGVDVFPVTFESNRYVLERNLEPRFSVQLSRIVTDLIEAPLASPTKADLVVRGEILEYRRRGGVRTGGNELVETGVKIVARAELVDRRTGALVSPPVTASVWSGYSLDNPLNEEFAADRALGYIAQTLVLELFHPGVTDAEALDAELEAEPPIEIEAGSQPIVE